jgi:hypothetical protein
MDNNEIDQSLKHLLELGYISLSYTDDLEAVFTITEEGKEFVKGLNFGI